MPEAATQTPAEAPIISVPPRFWWLKRLSAAAAIYVLLLFGVRLWWGHTAHARLEARLAEYRAKGEPIALADFATQPVADKDNAANDLSKAAAIVPRANSRQLDIADLNRQSCAENLAALQPLLATNQRVLDLVHAARDKPECDWGVRLTSPASNTWLPFLAPQRHLARFLRGAALIHHFSSADDAAIEDVQDMLQIGKCLGTAQPTTLIGHLVAVAVRSAATRTIEDITPDLRVTGAQLPSPEDVHPATHAQVQALIATLLDERTTTDGWRHALQCERAFQLDSVQSLMSPGLAASAGSPRALVAAPAQWLLSPAWELDALRMLDAATRMLEAGSAATWPEAAAQWPQRDIPQGPIRWASRFMSGNMLPAMDNASLSSYRDLTDRRLAALALAVRLYELDHGRRPDMLAALVPTYIPAIPLDPFDADDAPLRYAPDAPSPLLYSVGNDGADDHGAFVLLVGGGDVDPNVKDRPFFLSGDRPLRPSPKPAAQLPPASTQAVPEDQQPEDAERKQQQEQPQQ